MPTWQGERGWDLVGEFRRRDTRLRKIRAAMAVLEEQARIEAAHKAKAKEREQTASDKDDEPKPRGRGPFDPCQAKPKDRTQRNFTEAEVSAGMTSWPKPATSVKTTCWCWKSLV